MTDALTRERAHDEISDDEFDDALMTILKGLTADRVIDIPDVYEALSEYFNNDALDLARQKKDGNA